MGADPALPASRGFTLWQMGMGEGDSALAATELGLWGCEGKENIHHPCHGDLHSWGTGNSLPVSPTNAVPTKLLTDNVIYYRKTSNFHHHNCLCHCEKNSLRSYWFFKNYNTEFLSKDTSRNGNVYIWIIFHFLFISFPISLVAGKISGKHSLICRHVSALSSEYSWLKFNILISRWWWCILNILTPLPKKYLELF